MQLFPSRAAANTRTRRVEHTPVDARGLECRRSSLASGVAAAGGHGVVVVGDHRSGLDARRTADQVTARLLARHEQG